MRGSKGKRWQVKNRQQCKEEIALVSKLILNHTQDEVAEITGMKVSKVKNILYRHTVGVYELRRLAKLSLYSKSDRRTMPVL